MNLLGMLRKFGDRVGIIELGPESPRLDAPVKIQTRAVVGLIAHEAVEGDDGAVFGGANAAGQCGDIDRLSHQLVDVIVGKCRHVDASPAAHRREKRNLVSRTEWRIPGGKFLVARSDDR